MYLCPVCKTENNSCLCKNCGFDISFCAEIYPTLSRGAAGMRSVSAVRNAHVKKLQGGYQGYLSCSVCGSINFNIRLKDMSLFCAKCGEKLQDIAAVNKKEDDLPVSKVPSDNKKTRKKQYPEKTETIADADKKKSVTDEGNKKEMAEEIAETLKRRIESTAMKSRRIVHIAAEDYFTVALKENGTVSFAGGVMHGVDHAAKWKDIVAVAAGKSHVVGLKADGTVAAAGSNSYGQCNVQSWSGIKAVAAGDSHTVGLKYDGTVCAVGSVMSGAANIDRWENMYKIFAGEKYTAGIKTDLTALIVTHNNGMAFVNRLNNIKTITFGATNYFALTVSGEMIVGGKKQEDSNWIKACICRTSKSCII